MGLRDDVGIVPYKLDVVRSIQFNILFLKDSKVPRGGNLWVLGRVI